jgi:hypothetical protein
MRLVNVQRRDFAQRKTQRLRHADGARHLHVLVGEDLIRIGAAFVAGKRHKKPAPHIEADRVARQPGGVGEFGNQHGVCSGPSLTVDFGPRL